MVSLHPCRGDRDCGKRKCEGQSQCSASADSDQKGCSCNETRRDFLFDDLMAKLVVIGTEKVKNREELRCSG